MLKLHDFFTQFTNFHISTLQGKVLVKTENHIWTITKRELLGIFPDYDINRLISSSDDFLHTVVKFNFWCKP